MIREIDITEWELFGGGAEGEGYNNKKDSGLMLKLYNENAADGVSQRDYNISKAVSSLGLPTPEAYEMVTCNGRHGVIYERLQNKKSLNRIMADDYSQLDMCTSVMAEMLTTIHSTKVPEGLLPSCTEKWMQVIAAGKATGILNDAQYTKMYEAYKNADAPFAVFGDPNTSNVVISNGKPYIIDIGTFTYGASEYDMGMLAWGIVGSLDKKQIEETSHLKYEQNVEIRDLVLKKYLKTDSKEAVEAFMDKLRPFGAFIPVGIKLGWGELPGYEEKLTAVLGI